MVQAGPQERWQQNVGMMPLVMLITRSGRGGLSQKDRGLLRQSHSSGEQGLGTRNNLDTMAHTSPREPVPYLATHLLCSRCQQRAGKAPNPLQHGHNQLLIHASMVRDTPHPQGQPIPLAACPVSLSFPSGLFSLTNQPVRDSLFSPFPCNLLCDLTVVVDIRQCSPSARPARRSNHQYACATAPLAA